MYSEKYPKTKVDESYKSSIDKSDELLNVAFPETLYEQSSKGATNTSKPNTASSISGMINELKSSIAGIESCLCLLECRMTNITSSYIVKDEVESTVQTDRIFCIQTEIEDTNKRLNKILAKLVDIVQTLNDNLN